MPEHLPKTDEYIAKAAPFAQPILHHLRMLVHQTCPQVVEAWKWSFPHFLYHGEILCSMAAFKEHAVFGFWKAALLADDHSILSIQSRESMGHLGKLCSLHDLPPDEVLAHYIIAAMKLNEAGIKQPARKTKAANENKELITPPLLAAALAVNELANEQFGKFNYSQRKEYMSWVNDAKTETTRSKRVAQAIEWIAEGKGRNWKYEKC